MEDFLDYVEENGTEENKEEADNRWFSIIPFFETVMEYLIKLEFPYLYDIKDMVIELCDEHGYSYGNEWISTEEIRNHINKLLDFAIIAGAPRA
jgi:hypothetical protein